MSIAHTLLYNENFKVWNCGDTVEGKFRAPSPYLPSFMTIRQVWYQEQHDEVRCLQKTCRCCSVLWVWNNDKNLLFINTRFISLKLVRYQKTDDVVDQPREECLRGCTHATNHSWRCTVPTLVSSIDECLVLCHTLTGPCETVIPLETLKHVDIHHYPASWQWLGTHYRIHT